MAIRGAEERQAQAAPYDEPWPAALRGGLSCWAACIAGYLLVAAVVESAGLDPHRYPQSPWWSKPFRLYARGDAGHFLNIARYGYFGPHSDAVTPAYFPGYPLAGRTLARMVSVGEPSVTTYLVALAVLSWLGTATAAVLLWRLVADPSGPAGPRVAAGAVIALLAGPYSMFLVASYSEGPFLALALGAWLAGRKDRWLLASLLASFAAVTRVSGVFLACALVVMYARSRRSLDWQALSLTAPFLAAAGYFGWLRNQTGSWTTWFDAERLGWGRHTVAPWTALTNSVRRLFHLSARGSGQLWALGFQDTMELLFAAGFVVAIAVLVRRRRWPEVTYVSLTALSLLTSAYYLSVPRSMVICFPVWILVGEWAVSSRRRWLVGLAAGCSLVVAVVNATSMLSDHWSG